MPENLDCPWGEAVDVIKKEVAQNLQLHDTTQSCSTTKSFLQTGRGNVCMSICMYDILYYGTTPPPLCTLTSVCILLMELTCALTVCDSPFHPDRQCNFAGRETTERKHGNWHLWYNNSYHWHHFTSTSTLPFSLIHTHTYTSLSCTSPENLQLILDKGLCLPFIQHFILVHWSQEKR